MNDRELLAQQIERIDAAMWTMRLNARLLGMKLASALGYERPSSWPEEPPTMPEKWVELHERQIDHKIDEALCEFLKACQPTCRDAGMDLNDPDRLPWERGDA